MKERLEQLEESNRSAIDELWKKHPHTTIEFLVYLQTDVLIEIGKKLRTIADILERQEKAKRGF